MEVLWVSESNAFLEVFWGVLDVFWIFWKCFGFSGSVFGFLELLGVFLFSGAVLVFWKWVGFHGSALVF